MKKAWKDDEETEVVQRWRETQLHVTTLPLALACVWVRQKGEVVARAIPRPRGRSQRQM